MHRALRLASCATRYSSSLLRFSSTARPTTSLTRGQQTCTRLSSTDSTSAAKSKTAKIEANAPKHKSSSSVNPLPKPPPAPKGAPPTICTRDVEKYIQPLYSRGWGLSPILPNGNGIPVLRKRFDFVSAQALETFLVALGEYEERRQHHANTNVIEDQHAVLVSTWTHVARRPNADVEDKDSTTQGVTARDIRLAYTLEKLFENALAASGGEYVPRLRPEADRPTTVEELDS